MNHYVKVILDTGLEISSRHDSTVDEQEAKELFGRLMDDLQGVGHITLTTDVGWVIVPGPRVVSLEWVRLREDRATATFPGGRRRWDPTRPDSFAPLINRTDAEVDALLSAVRDQLREGEYDQDCAAVLEWDLARDLLTVADFLWHGLRAGTLSAHQPDRNDPESTEPGIATQ